MEHMLEGILDIASAPGQVIAWCGEGLWSQNALHRVKEDSLEETSQLSPEGYKGDGRSQEESCRPQP